MKKIRIGWVLILLGLTAGSASPQELAATISTGEISRGQRGWGLSVFTGTAPERFEVEVLGVLHHSTPELSYILARLSGHGLERSGVAGGMSGSPVYFDGKLAGAVAFSYLFGLDAVAGITPIDAMRRLKELPAVPTGPQARMPVAAGHAAPGVEEIELEDLVRREFDGGVLDRHLKRLRPADSTTAHAAVAWAAAGFGDEAIDLLRRSVGSLTTAGAMGPAGGVGGEAVELVPGSAVAAVLVEGDLSLAAHGTVTDRIGDEILAFGHQMFALGPVNMPLASSEVVTVLASAASSFKLSNAGPIVGAFDQDREAGVRGRLGLTARMTPLAVRLRGLVEKDYAMDVASMPQLRPSLVAVSVLGAIGSGSYAAGSQGLDLDVQIDLGDLGELPVRQSFDGPNAAIDAVVHLLGFLSYLDGNPLEEVAIDRVDVELLQADHPRSEALLEAHAGRTRVAPGDRVPVTLVLQPYRGGTIRRTISVEIPSAAPDGRYVVLIGDGTSMDAARLGVERRDPQSFAQVLAVLRSLKSKKELVTFGLLQQPGLALAGEVMPGLPGSMRAIFAGSGRLAAAPLNYTLVQETAETLEEPIEGVVRVDFEVERRP